MRQKEIVHIPTFFFLLHVNVCGSIAVPFQNPLREGLFPVTSNVLFILPLLAPNRVTVSQTREFSLTNLDISSETQVKQDYMLPQDLICNKLPFSKEDICEINSCSFDFSIFLTHNTEYNHDSLQTCKDPNSTKVQQSRI